MVEIYVSCRCAFRARALWNMCGVVVNLLLTDRSFHFVSDIVGFFPSQEIVAKSLKE